METTIDFSKVKRFYQDCQIVGVHSYRTESHNWVEISVNNYSPEEGVKLALSQGAIEIALMMKDDQFDDSFPVTFDIHELIKDKWSDMLNKAMQRKLRKGEAVDVCGCTTLKEGHYILDDFFEDTDYCDAEKEQWIWSIGVQYATGKIVASTSSNLYQNPEFECIFLR